MRWPRGDVATLKKIANPLKLGVMHEQAFVLGHAWPELLNKARSAVGGHCQGSLCGQLRGWIEEEQPGLPVGVQNLVVVCYSIQTDKEWLRGGQPIPMPTVARVADDMALRGTELPTEAEFEGASLRAAGDLPHQAGTGAKRALRAGARRCAASAATRSGRCRRPNRWPAELARLARRRWGWTTRTAPRPRPRGSS